MELTAVGKRVSKKDAPSKVTGSAVFIQDIALPGMLYGKILYSSYPHARIKSINTAKAEKLSGVKAVLTGATIPPFKFGVYKDNP
ncbi:MAG: xanthine dehydrogenase family protein molybdopterin-binding subunit, partial [Syntrophorhabdales bacterium]